MRNNKEPFEVEHVCLDLCTLQSTLPKKDATEISEFLAKMDPWLRLGISSEALFKYLIKRDPSLKRYGVYSNLQPIGVLCIKYPWLRGPYIELLGLEDSFQGKGITRHLLAWIECQTLPHAKNIWISASSFNTRATSIYERLGFTRVGILNDLVVEGESEILMRKRLEHHMMEENKPE